MINHQLGRRNITEQQRSYLRGVQYEREKAKHGGDRKSKAHPEPLIRPMEIPDTAEKLASQHKVGRETLKRDAQYARAVDAIAEAAGDSVRTELLSSDTKVSRQDAVKLGAIAESNQSGLA